MYGKLGAFAIIFIVLLISGCCCYTFPASFQSPPVPEAVQDYSFAKQGSITGSPDGDLTDYQMKLVVHRGSGTDNGTDVFLNGHSQSWPDDIRFAGDNGDLLSFWIESRDASTATFWVKINKISASPGVTTLRLYYGKGGEAGASNGDGTFILFDDFNDNSFDPGKWVEVLGDASADVYERNGELELKSGLPPTVARPASRPFIRSANAYGGNYTVEVNAKYLDPNSIIIATNWDGKLAGQYKGPNKGYECYFVSWATTGKFWQISQDIGNVPTSLGQYDYDQDYDFHKVGVTQKPTITLAIDDRVLLNGARDTTYTDGYVGLGGREGQNAVQTFYDDFRIRKYTQNPPAFGTWIAITR